MNGDLSLRHFPIFRCPFMRMTQVALGLSLGALMGKKNFPEPPRFLLGLSPPGTPPTFQILNKGLRKALLQPWSARRWATALHTGVWPHVNNL